MCQNYIKKLKILFFILFRSVSITFFFEVFYKHLVSYWSIYFSLFLIDFFFSDFLIQVHYKLRMMQSTDDFRLLGKKPKSLKSSYHPQFIMNLDLKRRQYLTGSLILSYLRLASQAKRVTSLEQSVRSAILTKRLP